MWYRTLGCMVTLIFLLLAACTAEVQQMGRVVRIGFLTPTTEMTMEMSASVGRRLGALGWVEGHSLAFEPRSADGQPDRLPDLAADLVRAKVDVMVVIGVQAIRAAKDATRTVPIVMWSGINPVSTGFVASLAQPGGNVAGVTVLTDEMTVKRLELLKEAIPRASRVAVLVNPRNSGSVAQLAALQSAAPAHGVRVQPVEVTRSGEYADASIAIASTRPDGIIVTGDPEFIRHTQAGVLRDAGVHRNRRPHVVQLKKCDRSRTACGVRRQAAEGRQARRLAHRAADRVRAGPQPQDRQGARDHDAPIPAPPG
jgi:putative tryptophan/tyrosine transport system substrate-binding protein